MNYLTQKGILRYFRDNQKEDTLKVYVSFVGHYRIDGRRGSSTGFKILEPTYLTFKYERDGIMMALHRNDNLEEDEVEDGDVMSRMFTSNRNNNPLYPLNNSIISHFDHTVDILDSNGEKVDFKGSLIDMIKFFESKEQSEINFVLMLRHYLEESNLIQALSTYDSIIDKHTITNPAELLRSI
ncbi:MAG: hypothetical protein DRH57_08570 [Candidatus Cloacimonadota bacterium]|nr:MAG: hypothetical protein DRH57_08570 [Candidatus Cloacimonadota bacterium]